MKCSRITLFDRRDVPTKLPKTDRTYQRSYQPELHNYVSWLNKPHSLYEEEQPYLTVCNISLPHDTTVFIDRGAQSKKWIQKRPRLQSAKVKRNSKLDYKDSEGDGDDDKDSQLMEIQQVMEEYEIDENVQKLIQEAAEYDQKIHDECDEDVIGIEDDEETDEDELDRRKLRRSAKSKEKRVKLSRTISFSRPPSPETIQVIRVDVTSNYSLDGLHYCSESEHNSEVCLDDLPGDELTVESNMGTQSNRLRPRKSLIKCPPELTLQCQKLALSDRKSTGQMQ